MQAGNSQPAAIGYRRANFLVSQPLNIIINSSKIDSHGRFIYIYIYIYIYIKLARDTHSRHHNFDYDGRFINKTMN